MHTIPNVLPKFKFTPTNINRGVIKQVAFFRVLDDLFSP